MKKVAAFILCLCLLSVLSMTAFAQGVTVSTEVPNHTLTVVAEKATVTINGVERDEYELERQSTPTIKIVPDKNRGIVSVKVNGVDVTRQLISGRFTLDPVIEDLELVVDTAIITSPATGDTSYIFLWVGLMAVSAIGVLLLIRRKKNA